MNSLETNCAGERLELFADKAAYWSRKETLLVADPHFGKAAAFRHAGLAVPEEMTEEDLRRLDSLLQATKARRIIFLGDFFHAKTGRSVATLRSLEQWLERHAALKFHLIRGNHDIRSGAIPDEWGFSISEEALCEPPFVFAHVPFSSGKGYVLAGHIHPAVRCGLRLPCFHFSERCAVLPAFGSFTGTHVVQPIETDKIFVVNEGGILELPPVVLKSLSLP